MALKITGNTKVKTLKSDFKKAFGLTIRVYDGRSFANDDATLASIRKNDNKGGELSPKRNMKVGNLEDKIQELFGIKTQISGSDDSYLCEDDHTLAKALEVDEKKLNRKAKKADKKDSNVAKPVTTTPQDSQSTMSLPEIIKEIKKVYSKHDDLNEIVSDLKDGEYVEHWANLLSGDDFSNNKELAKQLFQVALAPEDADYQTLAQSISNSKTLNDKVWGKEIFEKAIENTDAISSKMAIVRDLVNDIYMNDKEWAVSYAKKIEDELESINEYGEFIEILKDNLKDLEWAKLVVKKASVLILKSDDMNVYTWPQIADYALDKELLNDSATAKKIYNRLIESDDVSDLLPVALGVHRSALDKGFKKAYIDNIIKKAIDCVESDEYCEIYNFLKDDLEDEDKANEYKDKYYNQMKANHEEQGYGCEELFGSNDDEWEDEDSVDIDEIEFDDFDDRKNIIGFEISGTYDGEEDFDSMTDAETDAFINERTGEFISDIKNKFENHVEDKVYMQIDGKLQEYKSNFKAYYFSLYMILTKEIPADILNALLLDIDEYSFQSVYKNNNDTINQSYCEGEYDTGYFSNDEDESYVNDLYDCFSCYPEMEKLL